MQIKLAYSPDTDDAFMVYALKEGLIDPGPYKFAYTSQDIQTLNQAAKTNVYDITAISVAAYPDISDAYELMPVGASIGDAFGPAIVVPSTSSLQTVNDLAGKKIAVPGLHTSAYFASSILLPEFDAVPLAFHDIGPAVMSGAVDAGVLIHELQLNFTDFGFRRLADLGALWFERFNLPLPLGANAIKRSLGREHVETLNDMYKESIKWGLNNREFTVRAASARAFQGLSDRMADRYISMYVNENSLTLNANVQLAIDTLLGLAAERGLCRALTK